MKWFLAGAILVLAAIFLLHRPAPPAPPEPIAAATPMPIHVPVATPFPTPVRHLASEGTYFLTRRVSIATSDGVVGVAPGTKVVMISDNGLSMTVTAGVLKFNVAKAFLTNDLDVGVLLASQNSTELARANAQNAAQRKLLDQKAQVDAVQQSQAIIDAAKRSVDAANRAASGSGSRLQTSGDLMDGAYDQQSSIVEHSYTDAQGHVHTWHRTASGTTIGN